MRRALDNLTGSTEFRIILKSTSTMLLGDSCIQQRYDWQEAYQLEVPLEFSDNDALYHTHDNEGNIIDGYKRRTLTGVTPERIPEAAAYRIYYQASPEITPLAKVVFLNGQTPSSVEATLYLQQGANITEAHYPQIVPSEGITFLGWYRSDDTVYPTVNVNDTFWADGENEITVTLRPVWQYSNQDTPTPTYHGDDNTPTVDPISGDTPAAADLDHDNDLIQP